MIITTKDKKEIGQIIKLLYNPIEKCNIDQPALILEESTMQEYIEFWSKQTGKPINRVGRYAYKVSVD